MCGIAGIVARSVTPPQVDLVSRIVQSQVQRGPDYQAVEVVREAAPAIAFGHDRLSIIDLSDLANQPFWSLDRRFCITFNGEIYNYCEIRDELRQLGRTFRTASDTEVLVEAFAAWGVESIARFNGMFAFAIADTLERKVWLVRDRFGVKPLFYVSPNSNEIWFASTATVLSQELDLEPDGEYLSDGIRWLIYEDGSSRCQFKGLKTLEAGTYLEVQFGDDGLKYRTRRYYDLRARVEARQAELKGKGPQELVEITESLLRDAVRLRLRSDVPLGISLSGGIDSSLVACLAAQEGGHVTGVTFGHPDRQDTEGPLVQEIARHIGIDVQYVWPSGNAMREALWETVQRQEAPFPGLSIVAQYLVFQAARSAGLKVMLGGQGGDEVFMGYRKYLYMTLLRREHGSGIFEDLFGFAQVLLREAHRIRDNFSDLGRYVGKRPPALNMPGTERDLGLNGFQEARWRQLKDVTEFSLPTLLRYEDRNSAGNSVESRLPFMDYRLVETGLALPDRLKVRGGYSKWILRQIAERFLPPSVTRNRLKIGFDALTREWIRLGIGDDIRTRLRHPPGHAEWNGTHSLRDFELPFPERLGDEPLSRGELALSEAVTAIWLSDQSASRRAHRNELATA